MEMKLFFDVFGYAIYSALGLSALFGIFLFLLLFKRIREKKLSETAADAFFDDVNQMLVEKDFDGIADLCDSPPYWSKATPQMILVALANKDRPMRKLQQMLGNRFEREILADIEYGMSWINTIVKSAPMLGLLGTVSGMIQAFDKIATASASGGDPTALASDISFALFTTALGLSVAIPLVVAGAFLNVRIGKFQDSVQDQLGQFLENLDAIQDDE